MIRRGLAAVLLALACAGCTREDQQGTGQQSTGQQAGEQQTASVVPVTVAGPGVRHVFQAEVAATPAAQERGLMYRTGLQPDQAMLFAPYPADGGGPRVANFWMKNTPTPLDIVFVRPDGTIARIGENSVPFSEAMVSSGEPVAAVLEIVGGRAAELGIAEGDTVSWPGRH